MKFSRTIVSILFAATCIDAAPGVKQASMTHLDAFLAEPKPESLGQALELLRAEGGALSEPTYRAEVLLAFAVKLATAVDPAFDIDRPQASLNVSPGPLYQSGVAPESIADPAVREAYEKKLKANSLGLEKQRVQLAVQNALDSVGRDLRRIVGSPDLDAKEKAELKQKIKASATPERFKNAASVDKNSSPNAAPHSKP